MSDNRFKWNNNAKNVWEQGPTRKDSPGYVYGYRDANDPRAGIKIGRATDVEGRVRAQERANNKDYNIVFRRSTPCPNLTEQMMHAQLQRQHSPQKRGDGKTEWYAVRDSTAKNVADKAALKTRRGYN